MPSSLNSRVSSHYLFYFFFNDTATTEIYTLSLHDALPISNSTTGNNFAVSGNRPQQNLFLLNVVEYTGAAENNMQPGGTSGMLLGVDAVRVFNVLRDSYGAEFGKRPGGQVVIVTQSGAHQ